MVESTHGAHTLRKAFDEAAWHHRHEWSPGHPDHPKVIIDGKHFTIRAACELVKGFTDSLRGEVQDDLLYHMHDGDRVLKEELGRDPSYGTGARCLLRLMDKREAAFRLQESRHNR
jgi:hypothetical protein